MRAAPFHAALAQGPQDGRCYWVTAADGVTLRIGHWPGGARGTVLLLSGRSEWIEKYGRVATMLAARGYGVVTLDWRGQGLSQRLNADPAMGHVRRFSDYQRDISALFGALPALGLPDRLPVIAHSMGGCIALRALRPRGLLAATPAIAFSAPMWGLALSPGAWSGLRVLTALARAGGRAARYAPGTADSTLAQTPFEENMLTSDPDVYAELQHMVRTVPQLALAGPSLNWLQEALMEMRRLRALPSPAVPAHAALGSAERIIDTQAVEDRMARWPGGTLDVIDGAAHEIMMERPAICARFLDRATALFESAAAAP